MLHMDDTTENVKPITYRKPKLLNRLGVYIIIFVVIIIIGLIIVCNIIVDRRAARYESAEMLIQQGNYVEAEDLFKSLGNYYNSAARAEQMRDIISYKNAVTLFDESYYEEALIEFEKLGEYHDDNGLLPNNLQIEGIQGDTITSKQLARESRYLLACQLLRDGDYESASFHFTELGEYRDSEVLLATALLHFMPEVQERVFSEALKLMEDEKYPEALDLLDELVRSNYAPAFTKADECRMITEYFPLAQRLMDAGDYAEALSLLEQLESINYLPATAKADECRMVLKRYALAQSYSAGGNFSIAITAEGAILTTFSPLQDYFDIEQNFNLWRNVISIDIGDPLDSFRASRDSSLIVVGLTRDGRVIYNDRYNLWFEDNMKQYTKPMPIDIDEIENAVQVVTGADHLAVLTADGTVYAAGENIKKQCEVYSHEWTDPDNRVVMIAASVTMTVGLREDGTIITTLASMNEELKSKLETNRDDWSDIVYISVGGGTPDNYSTGDGHIVAITSKGKAIGVGHNAYGQIEFVEWNSNMVFASAGLWHTLGIKADRTVEVKVAGASRTGMFDIESHIKRLNPGTEMLYVSAGFGYSLGLTRESDGTLKLIHAGYDDFDKMEAEAWSDLVAYPEWERLRTDNAFSKMVLSPQNK